MVLKKLADIKNPEPRRGHGSIGDLKQSIAEIGLVNPLTIDEDGNLLAGRRRYQALKELGREEVDVRVLPVNGDQLKAFRVFIDENLKRKPLTDTELAAQIKEYDELKRKLEGSQPRGNPNLLQCNKLAGGWTQEQTARDLGISRPTVVKAIKIAKAVEKYPHLASKPGQVVLTEAKRYEAKTPQLPEGKYRTIVIDPPWPIEKILRDCRPNQYDMDYPTMTIEQIKALPITDLICEDGCHVYLWTVHKFLPTAFEVFRAWGVNYECLLTWVKNIGFTPYSWMHSTEHCLFGRIGSLPLLKQGERLDFFAKVREHSRKPDEFYNLVTRVSPEPRIDVFSREKHEGFDQYGNETAKFLRTENELSHVLRE